MRFFAAHLSRLDFDLVGPGFAGRVGVIARKAENTGIACESDSLWRFTGAVIPRQYTDSVRGDPSVVGLTGSARDREG